MDKYTTYDLINASVDQKPIEFENIFKSIIHDRVEDAINDMKINVAQNIYRGTTEETPEE